MVTLLGFFCILANVILLEIFMPDLVGPVSPFFEGGRTGGFAQLQNAEHTSGSILAVLQLCFWGVDVSRTLPRP